MKQDVDLTKQELSGCAARSKISQSVIFLGINCNYFSEKYFKGNNYCNTTIMVN